MKEDRQVEKAAFICLGTKPIAEADIMGRQQQCMQNAWADRARDLEGGLLATASLVPLLERLVQPSTTSVHRTSSRPRNQVRENAAAAKSNARNHYPGTKCRERWVNVYDFAAPSPRRAQGRAPPSTSGSCSG
eukprot:1416881-Rhodomonas_salina.3